MSKWDKLVQQHISGYLHFTYCPICYAMIEWEAGGWRAEPLQKHMEWHESRGEKE